MFDKHKELEWLSQDCSEWLWFDPNIFAWKIYSTLIEEEIKWKYIDWTDEIIIYAETLKDSLYIWWKLVALVSTDKGNLKLIYANSLKIVNPYTNYEWKQCKIEIETRWNTYYIKFIDNNWNILLNMPFI